MAGLTWGTWWLWLKRKRVMRRRMRAVERVGELRDECGGEIGLAR